MKEPKIYFTSKEVLLREDGYYDKDEERLLVPIDMIQGDIEEVVLERPNYAKSFFLFLGACFVFSQASVSKADIAPFIGFIVSVILFIASYWYFRLYKGNVYFKKKDYSTCRTGFVNKKVAKEFIKAFHQMLREHKAKQKNNV